MESEPGFEHANAKLRELSLSVEDSSESVDKKISLLSEKNLLESSVDAINNWSDNSFDIVIGHLEDMLIDDDFQALQHRFLEKYWEEFDNSEENKHSYMIIFNEYSNEIENFITKYLQKRIPNFDMDLFISELMKKKEIQEGELFEMLITLYDFVAFKENFLDYRAMKEGHTPELNETLCVSSVMF